MALKEYKKKRKFAKTPEPSGNETRSPKNKSLNNNVSGRKIKNETRSRRGLLPLRFVVQKHDASHLHYDFRLEMDGVLKSWAVPKGPSMDPDVKRLAMMVEDHPLDYMHFQGTIPKGNYGAGTVEQWDFGVYHSSETLDEKENRKKLKAGLKKGHINFVLLGEKLKGQFSLVKIKGDEKGNSWLLIKHKDEFVKKEEITKDEMPHNIKPMLAKLTQKPFDRKNWVFEIKYDGYRAITEIEKGKIKIYSRNGNDFTEKYSEITKELSRIKRDVVLDGEIVAIKDERTNFHALQNYEESHAPLQYYIFDLLYLDGEDLRGQPLHKRKEILKGLIPKNDKLIYCEHVEEKGLEFFDLVIKEGFEGMVAKDKDSIYREGTRSDSWLKVKYKNVQEAIIIGFTKPRGSRKNLGALVLGAHDNQGKLHYIGHSGGGFTDKELKELYEILLKIKVKSSPVKEKVPINSPITWVEPKYVCQIEFTEWTPDGRMRHPIYAGLREDKEPDDVRIENGKSNSDEETDVKKIDGKKSDSVNISNVNKVFWPDEGYTKGDVLKYYEEIAPTILPYLLDRPESLNRHPNGINGKNFFQKDVSSLKLPDFIQTKEIWSESNEKDTKYLLCQNKETLLYLANLGCIELNPWNSRIQSLDNPDYMIIDLDPGGRPFSDLIKVAQIVHKLLDQACEQSYIKTSGKKGLHIMVPMGAKYDYDTIRVFSELLVNIVHKRIPDITSVERSPAKRKNKIYLDFLQNRRGQTIAAPYSIRPWPGATVSTPLHWKEVKKGLDPAKFTIKTIFKRLKKHGDIWAPLLTNSVDLEESIKCLEKLSDER